MLSGEGNAGERWKTTIGLTDKKKQLCTCSTLFLYISLPLFCTITTWNFQKLLSYTFYGRNVVRVLVHFFSLSFIFTLHCWPLDFSFFHHHYKIFMLFLQQNNISFVFISRYRSLSPFFSSSFAGLPPTLSFSLSFSSSKFVDMTINLS